MRPDHGYTLGEEKSDERVRPGYSYAGRLKGLSRSERSLRIEYDIRGVRSSRRDSPTAKGVGR